MKDLHTPILDHLKNTPAVVAMTSTTRLYAGRNEPSPGYDPSQGRAICFKVRGGQPDYEDALLIPSYQFKCYGDTEAESYELYRTLYDALHNATSDDILHAESESIGQVLSEPDTNWIFTLAFFQIMVRAT